MKIRFFKQIITSKWIPNICINGLIFFYTGCSVYRYRIFELNPAETYKGVNIISGKYSYKKCNFFTNSFELIKSIPGKTCKPLSEDRIVSMSDKTLTLFNKNLDVTKTLGGFNHLHGNIAVSPDGKTFYVLERRSFLHKATGFELLFDVIHGYDTLGNKVFEWNFRDHHIDFLSKIHTTIFFRTGKTPANIFYLSRFKNLQVAPNGNLFLSAYKRDSSIIINTSTKKVDWAQQIKIKDEKTLTSALLDNSKIFYLRRSYLNESPVLLGIIAKTDSKKNQIIEKVEINTKPYIGNAHAEKLPNGNILLTLTRHSRLEAIELNNNLRPVWRWKLKPTQRIDSRKNMEDGFYFHKTSLQKNDIVTSDF